MKGIHLWLVSAKGERFQPQLLHASAIPKPSYIVFMWSLSVAFCQLRQAKSLYSCIIDLIRRWPLPVGDMLSLESPKSKSRSHGVRHLESTWSIHLLYCRRALLPSSYLILLVGSSKWKTNLNMIYLTSSDEKKRSWRINPRFSNGGYVKREI